MALKNNLVEFPDLSRQSFQHPLDLQAAGVLKQVPGLPRLVRFMSETVFEQQMHYTNVSSNLRVNAQQYPSLHRQFVRMAQVLDVKKLPSLYVSTTPWTINAYAMGIENYSIVICSGLLDILEDSELMAILGHELGHVKCEHQLYKTMAYWMTNFGDLILSQAKIPGLDLVLGAGRIGLDFALLDWSRKAELSCDRAALLATQDPDAVARALAKLAGFSRKYQDELSLAEAERQSDLYHDLGGDSLIMKLIKLKALSQTHPYPVVRVKEVLAWSRAPEYQQILAGNYRKNTPALLDGTWKNVSIETPRARECPKCKYPCGEDYVFCPSCQTNVRASALICSSCRQAVEGDWSACITCGSWLSKTPPAPGDSAKLS
jgi:Zn-dependent protease with chaperone function